jgi:hypothetical protein
MIRENTMRLNLTTNTIACLALGFSTATVGAQEWGSIKGKFVFDGPEAPKPKTLDVTKDQEHCLKNGPLVDETFQVDAKTKAIKNVIVYVKSPKVVHPDLPQNKEAAGKKFFDEFKKLNGFDYTDLKSKHESGAIKLRDLKGSFVLDQVNCRYSPRTLAIQQGMPLLVLNPEPIAHNVKSSSVEAANEKNPNMPPNTYEVFELVACGSPVQLACSIHGWMTGAVMVLDHPYFTLSAEDGTFEIKNVPAGSVPALARFGNGKFVDLTTGGKGKASTPRMIEVTGGGLTDVGEVKVKAELFE